MKMRRLLIVLLFAAVCGGAWAGSVSVTVTDATPTAPVANPTPASYQPRYISGFGSGDNFTVFFEDRDNASTISYVSTTTGPTGFPAAVTRPTSRPRRISA